MKTEEYESDSSGFATGLLIGAIIGAVVAVIIYRNDKSTVFKNFIDKVEKYFKNLFPADESEPPSAKTVRKIPVELPPKLIAAETPVPKASLKPKKMFRKK